ncbi:MAG TPA: hypothetical protein VFS49_06500 [Croceibacterium sp.]|nr:hypothetical protein [Croceibacterium sp.]
MADLALILFMVTAAGIHAQHQQQEQRPRPAAAVSPLSAQGEPLAVYRAQAGAPPLARWLAEQAPDRRQFLTIVARYRAGNVATAAREAVALAREAGAAGVAARIVLEPGETDDLLATLAFDRPDGRVAQPLQPAT